MICVSASKQVKEGLERRTNGFAYVQGSGDDHELWGQVRLKFDSASYPSVLCLLTAPYHQGLTPSIFWQHKDRLLLSNRSNLENLVAQLVSMEHSDEKHDNNNKKSPSPIARVHGRILIGPTSEFPSPSDNPDPSCARPSGPTAYILITACTPAPAQQHNPATDDDCSTNSEDTYSNSETPANLILHLSPGKRGQHEFLDSVLPQSLPFIDTHLARDVDSAICICCDTGKDASVGVALAALQLFFDDDGLYVPVHERGKFAGETGRSEIHD